MRALLQAVLCGLLALVALPRASQAGPTEPLLLVTDPPALHAAEAAGAGFARWFSRTEDAPGGDGIVANDRLAGEPSWQSIVQPIRASIAGIARLDPQAGIGISRHPHRLFDTRWLESGAAFFELVGIVNRLDRRPFTDQACGETRLVYRLAYRSASERSRLPMTVAVELRGEPRDADGSCRGAARLWQAPVSAGGPGLGHWLVSPDGPLAPSRLSRGRVLQLAVNLQSVRWPSGVKPDLGGHAEYVMRAYRWRQEQGRYEPGGLENTPDVGRLKRDEVLRSDLLDWLRRADSLAALDEGSLRLPDRFLAKEAVSVAPLGAARSANRPFSQVFLPADWTAVQDSRTLTSPSGILRRLDDMTCSGCHQSRSVAGFHLLGTDRAGATRTYGAGNALALPGSPHLEDELARRARYAIASLAEPAANPFRPLAGAGTASGGFGAPCGLSADRSVAGWTCAIGLTCRPHGEGGMVGVCMPQAGAVGALCEPSIVKGSLDPRKDVASRQRGIDCGPSAHCERTNVGFSGGMCSGSCDPGDPDAICGKIAILDGFNRCLAARQPFEACLSRHTRPGNLRACSAQRPCRDDYICAEADEAAPGGTGACIPPYFLFQMRVDGHPG